ncbi:MAG: hypothetical protein ACP5NO_08010, partial [Thermoplasmata archaeon]
MNNKEYSLSPSSGSFTVNGTVQYININFSLMLYEVSFIEKGLPLGTTWYVNLSNGKSYSNFVNYIVIELFNGSYSYTISTTNKDYEIKQFEGNFTIKGANLTINITFEAVNYSVSFIESGLPYGSSWYVNLSNGQSYSSSSNTITFNETNGTYPYILATGNKDYAPTQYSGSLTVNGAPVSESITFNLVTYKIIFTESGLSSGTTWYVTLNNITKSSSNNTIIFDEPNGSYSYTIQGISGYRTSNYSGSLMVNGNSVNENIVWSIILYPITITENGISNGTAWSATLTGTTFNG